jgi:hypothetical protein
MKNYYTNLIQIFILTIISIYFCILELFPLISCIICMFYKILLLQDKWYVAFHPQRGAVLTSSENSQPSCSMPEFPSPAPWRRLLSSPPVWGCAIAVMGSQWGMSTLLLAGPKYLQLVYGFAITQVRYHIAITSAIPTLYFLIRIFFL